MVLVENRDLTGTTPRIWAVIIGDTTCGISLLTDTIHGSNFAVPSTQIQLAGARSRSPGGEDGSMRHLPRACRCADALASCRGAEFAAPARRGCGWQRG